jgi:ABC-type multidrug transport system ATPase subunit
MEATASGEHGLTRSGSQQQLQELDNPSNGRGVDVDAAKRIFEDAESRINDEADADAGTNTSSSGANVDLERAESKHVGQFNLRDWVTNYEDESAKVGSKRKQLGVSWSDLSVQGADSMDMKVPTIPSMAIFEVIGPIFSLINTFGIKFPKRKSRNLLQGFSGSAKPGEMVLVLGRPGAGCSTFLKTIANQRNGFMGVTGDVHYGGIDAKEMSKRFKGQVIYSEEDDVHNATLTVSQTIDFALRVKATSKLLPEHSRKTFRKMIRDTLLKMFDVEHTKHTLVGSPTVRGVSGGERKRVSIMEVLCSGAAVIGWDNTSRGLDASTALDYAKSMRILTDVLETTMFVSLYQASESIWEQFDKVLVIDEGRCVYYGPRTQARQYFYSLGFGERPRQTSADYVTGMTDKYERIFQEGRSESNVPCSPEQLEEAYQKSDIYKQVLSEKNKFDEAVKNEEKARADEFRVAVKQEKHAGVRPHSQYTVPFWEQVYALFLRQMQMKAGDKFDIFMSYVTAIVLALLIGGIFFKMPTTTDGVFIRGGDLFILLLFSTLTAFAEMPTQMMGRPILARQAGYAFYRPAAQLIASLIADFPFGIPRTIMFTVIVYFMSGLALSAGAFFTALLIIHIAYYVFRCLFTLFGVVTRNFYTAARLAAIVMTLLVLWAGYVIPQFTMARWLFWISYINPVYYAFEAMMINEFSRVIFTCAGGQIIPNGANINSGSGVNANQVCTLPGATAGTDQIPGQAYLDAAFQYSRGHLWRNVGILFAFLFGLILLTCWVVEVQDQGAFASAITVKKPANKEEKKLDERLADRRSGATEKTEAKLEVHGQAFTWSQLRYTVPVKGGKRLLLDNVDGFVKPGSMTALMGASGAGKTTLLDVLADRKTIGVIEGERLIEGRHIDRSFQRQCGYAEQQDIHEPMCSVREALRFSAYLRQSYDVPKEEKDQYVEDIIELLELHDLADAIIGYPGFGLGVGDRKRVTIGVELAAKPEMLLFLDEPTSGLDGQSAFTICRLLRKLADNGQTILCTIHQPSALLFETFDRLLLLERGGKVVYFGPVGKDGQHIIDYFAERGAQCPPGINMAEYMLDAIGAGSQPRVGDRDWADHYLDSKLYKDNVQQIKEINEQGLKKPPTEGRKSEYAAPWTYQFNVVLKRTLLSTWRQPAYQYTRLVQHFVFALLTGLLFLQLGNTYATLQYRIFAIFMVAIIPAIIMAQIQPFWIMSRSIWIREETSKTFDGTVFAATQLISEVPYALACATVFHIPLFYLIGFQHGLDDPSNRSGVFWVVAFLVELFAISLGAMISSFCSNAYLASLFTPFLVVIFSLTCGVLSPPNQMSSTLYSKFFYNVNPMRYAIATLTTNVLHGLEVVCAPGELYSFTPPANTDCGTYAGAFAQTNGGYLVDPSNTSQCQYCPVRSGDDFFAPFGMQFSERGRNIGILVAFTAFNTLATIFFTKFLHFSNR